MPMENVCFAWIATSTRVGILSSQGWLIRVNKAKFVGNFGQLQDRNSAQAGNISIPLLKQDYPDLGLKYPLGYYHKSSMEKLLYLQELIGYAGQPMSRLKFSNGFYSPESNFLIRKHVFSTFYGRSVASAELSFVVIVKVCGQVRLVGLSISDGIRVRDLQGCHNFCIRGVMIESLCRSQP